MTYRGHVEKGVIILNPPVQLPEGAEVEVSTTVQASTQATWADVLRDVIGQAEGLPADSSLNHDHYLYGAGKK
jgi:predicted DNA-binding antitoxin AbrB/MazE fold protein